VKSERRSQVTKAAAVKKADTIDAKMRRSGYLSVSEAAVKVGCNPSTISRWADEGGLRTITAMESRRYVNVRDLVQKVGIEASVIVGLITQEQADQIRKSKG
jgi:predicted DNA-binding transcriptional regulator AlpA